jgi:hypothetical protein
MKLQEVTAYNLKSEAILTESQSWEMLTEQQRIYVGSWEKNVWPLVEQYSKLMEADLKPDQIKKIFQDAEKVSIEGGENMTALGKAGKVTAEVSGKMKAEIDKLMDAAANSGPVKNFDAQFEKLKSQLKTKLQGNPAGQKILAGVEKWGGFAKDNPAKSAFIIGAMTSVLAFASGGILSGAAIGFFLKLANNTIKGDKLSTAMAKGVKGAAIGAIAGALGDAIGGAAEDMFPPEITQTFMTTNGEIDITQLDAMADGVSIEDLDSEDIKELIQSRQALLQVIPKVDGEASEVLDQQLKALNDKIFELEPDGANAAEAIDNLQDKFGIEGKGVDIVVKQNVTGDANVNLADPDKLGDEGDYGSEPEQNVGGTGKDTVDTTSTADPDGDVGAEGTVKATYSSEEMNELGMDTSNQPESKLIADAVTDTDLTPAEVEKLQQVYQMEKAIENRKFLGYKMSAETSMKDYMGGEAKVIDGLEGEYTAGSTFKKEITASFEGTDKPWTAMVTGSVEGVDADGNIVYSYSNVFVGPDVMDSSFWDILDKLPEAKQEEIMKAFDTWRETADMETSIDDFKAQMAEKVMQGAAAVALGGALAKAEYVEPDKAKKESRVYKTAEQLEDEYFDLFEDYRLDEIDIKGMAKKAAAGAANITKAAAKGTGKAVGAGLDKAGAVANKGIGKAVGAVKSGAAKAGKELGQKVTYAKLEKDWKKAGEPTDVGSIAKILSDRGMSDEQIGTVATNTGQADLKVQGAEKSTASSGGVGGGTKGDDEKAPEPGKDAGAKTGGVGGGAAGAGGGAGASASSPDPKADKDGDGKADGDSASTLQGKASGDPFNDGPFDMKSSPPKGTNAGATKDDFEWKGAQWISKSTGKVADKGTAAKLGNPKMDELIRQIQDKGQVDLAVAYLSGGGDATAKAPAGGKPAAPGKSAASKRPDQRFQQQPTV